MTSVIFDVCEPRPDVLAGAVESDFAADLARVVRGEATGEYADPMNGPAMGQMSNRAKLP